MMGNRKVNGTDKPEGETMTLIRCYCSPGCNHHRWATIVEAIELGLLGR
jgi:hypothetical protein